MPQFSEGIHLFGNYLRTGCAGRHGHSNHPGNTGRFYDRGGRSDHLCDPDPAETGTQEVKTANTGKQTKRTAWQSFTFTLAERRGFEPRRPVTDLRAFQARPFNPLGIPPALALR